MSSWWICFFCLLKMLTDGLEWCGLLVDYCDVFISCLDSHSDGTHSLQSIYCWDTDGMLHFSKSDEETNWPAHVSSSSSSRVTGSPVHPRLHVGLVWIGLGGKLLLSSKLSRVHTSITSSHRVHVTVWVHHGVPQHLNTHMLYDMHSNNSMFSELC